MKRMLIFISVVLTQQLVLKASEPYAFQIRNSLASISNDTKYKSEHLEYQSKALKQIADHLSAQAQSMNKQSQSISQSLEKQTQSINQLTEAIKALTTQLSQQQKAAVSVSMPSTFSTPTIAMMSASTSYVPPACPAATTAAASRMQYGSPTLSNTSNMDQKYDVGNASAIPILPLSTVQAYVNPPHAAPDPAWPDEALYPAIAPAE